MLGLENFMVVSTLLKWQRITPKLSIYQMSKIINARLSLKGIFYYDYSSR